MNEFDNNTGTASVWAGEEHLSSPRTPSACRFYNSVTFGYDDMEEWHPVGMEQKGPHLFAQHQPHGTPARRRSRIMDGGEEATSFSTGMAAISNTLFALLAPGDRVVAIRTPTAAPTRSSSEVPAAPQCRCVHGRHQRFRGHRARSQEGLQGALSRDPDQPTLKIVDIERLAKVAHGRMAPSWWSTTPSATPINQRPISLGADIVVSSATKYLNGHSDVMGGLAVGKKGLIDQIFHYREITSATLHPQSAYMILRGMKTQLRIARHNENAMKVATFLSQHPSRPGSSTQASKPTNHDIAKRQMRGFGGMLSFSLKGGFENVVTVLENLSTPTRRPAWVRSAPSSDRRAPPATSS